MTPASAVRKDANRASLLVSPSRDMLAPPSGQRGTPYAPVAALNTRPCDSVRLARGHTIADVAAVTSFVPRWIEQLLARYNAHGPEALGDLRRRSGSAPSVLRPELLARLPERLATPRSDGGLWTGPKVARWMAGELGLAAVLPQRGWEALKAIDWSVQKPRPRHPAAATPEECETFKKSWPRSLPRKRQSTRTNRLRSGPRMSTALG